MQRADERPGAGAHGQQSAFQTATKLYAARGDIYGWSRRIKRHWDNIRFSFGGATGLRTEGPDAKYKAGTGASISEMFLVYRTSNGLQIADCIAARLVPDSEGDSLAEASAKLMRLLDLLEAPPR